MNREQLEKTYRDLPTIHRDRWAGFEAFRVQADSRQHADVDLHLRTTLPRALEENEFGGLASAFGTKIDTWMPTFIEHGSFAKTLADRQQQKRVKVLYQHDRMSPIGVPTLMEETQDGLLVIGKVSETQTGKDVLTLLRDGVITEMSIGFDPVEFYFKEDSSGELCRFITECRLWEFSPVTHGANRGAKISQVNSLSPSELDALADKILERMQRQKEEERLAQEAQAIVARQIAELEQLSRLLQ